MTANLTVPLRVVDPSGAIGDADLLRKQGLRALFSGVDDPALVDNVVRLLVYAPVTSETQAAAYRLLASIPGVSAVSQEKDTLGRTGQALKYQSAWTVSSPWAHRVTRLRAR